MNRRVTVLGGLTLLATGAMMVALPSGHALTSVWLLVAYLVPFVLAAETIAALPLAWCRRWRLAEFTMMASFALIFCVFVPRMFGRVLADDFPGFYALMRMLAPLLILTIALPYRLGGGAPGGVRRVAYAGLLVMLSGIEDLLFWVWRGAPIPARWDWADHMTVILGHVATRTQAYAFIGVHLAAALAVLLWPSGAARRDRPAQGSQPEPQPARQLEPLR